MLRFFKSLLNFVLVLIFFIQLVITNDVMLFYNLGFNKL